MGNHVIFMYSYHQMNTQKITNSIAGKINALLIDIKTNDKPINLDAYDLIGFSAGIAVGKHYPQMMSFVEKLPDVQNKKAFIISTSGGYSNKKMKKNHKALRNLLQKKGFIILDEFGCKGYTAFKIFKFTFRMNKGRPNDEDIKNAEIFADKLLNNCTDEY
ncbi:MAG: flavodoxin [Treponema sp.]|nr:flavodoxin [Treponema sp.]